MLGDTIRRVINQAIMDFSIKVADANTAYYQKALDELDQLIEKAKESELQKIANNQLIEKIGEICKERDKLKEDSK